MKLKKSKRVGLASLHRLSFLNARRRLFFVTSAALFPPHHRARSLVQPAFIYVNMEYRIFLQIASQLMTRKSRGDIIPVLPSPYLPLLMGFSRFLLSPLIYIYIFQVSQIYEGSRQGVLLIMLGTSSHDECLVTAIMPTHRLLIAFGLESARRWRTTSLLCEYSKVPETSETGIMSSSFTGSSYKF